MDFSRSIGFICNDKKEWMECQTILFKEGFVWNLNSDNKFIIDGYLDFKNIYPIIIYINQDNNHKDNLFFGTFENYHTLRLDVVLYESKILFRKYKLEEIGFK